MAIRIALLAVILFAQSTAWASPDIEHWTMRNGVRVYFVASHNLPMVNVRVVFDAGSARDGKGKNGLSSLTGTLLDKGAGLYNTGQIAARFEGLGAEFSASAGRDMAAIALRSLSNPRMLHTDCGQSVSKAGVRRSPLCHGFVARRQVGTVAEKK
jgi:zinc protease